jgi:hypothetical protein
MDIERGSLCPENRSRTVRSKSRRLLLLSSGGGVGGTSEFSVFLSDSPVRFWFIPSLHRRGCQPCAWTLCLVNQPPTMKGGWVSEKG